MVAKKKLQVLNPRDICGEQCPYLTAFIAVSQIIVAIRR